MPRTSVDRAASQLVINAYETERSRLARELHDGPVQILANAIFELRYCEALLDRDPAALRAALAHVQEDLKESLRELRRGMLELRPTSLIELGLAPTLRQYGAEFERHFGIPVQTDLHITEIRLSGEAEVALFRIVQEALTNVRKHARASRVRLTARKVRGDLVIRVDDNGQGFIPSPNGAGDTFGLTSMRERAELVGATLRIRARRGGGTTVELRYSLESVGSDGS